MGHILLFKHFKVTRSEHFNIRSHNIRESKAEMRIPKVILTAIVLTVSGCATTAPDNVVYERITSKEQYVELVTGRAGLSKGSNISTTTFADGTMKGGGGGKTFSGTWTWEEEYFCREGTIGSNVLKRDCQTVEISGDSLKIGRNKGKGESVVYILK